MSKAPVQSRKMCFAEVEEEAQTFFEEAFDGHEVSFVKRLDAVPVDTEVLSVFISERVDAPFLDAHPLIRLLATRSTGCDHIDLDACDSRGVTVANVSNYGENTAAEHTFALILALSRRPERFRAGCAYRAHSQLLRRPEVVLTPHVAFNSHEANERLSTLTVENIRNYLEGRSLTHCCP